LRPPRFAPKKLSGQRASHRCLGRDGGETRRKKKWASGGRISRTILRYGGGLFYRQVVDQPDALWPPPPPQEAHDIRAATVLSNLEGFRPGLQMNRKLGTRHNPHLSISTGMPSYGAPPPDLSRPSHHQPAPGFARRTSAANGPPSAGPQASGPGHRGEKKLIPRDRKEKTGLLPGGGRQRRSCGIGFSLQADRGRSFADHPRDITLRAASCTRRPGHGRPNADLAGGGEAFGRVAGVGGRAQGTHNGLGAARVLEAKRLAAGSRIPPDGAWRDLAQAAMPICRHP